MDERSDIYCHRLIVAHTFQNVCAKSAGDSIPLYHLNSIPIEMSSASVNVRKIIRNDPIGQTNLKQTESLIQHKFLPHGDLSTMKRRGKRYSRYLRRHGDTTTIRWRTTQCAHLQRLRIIINFQHHPNSTSSSKFVKFPFKILFL